MAHYPEKIMTLDRRSDEFRKYVFTGVFEALKKRWHDIGLNHGVDHDGYGSRVFL
jgi:hypothetical protein